ncbi:MAG: IPT/TIG domain-containing protein [Candidatus Dormibacteria bacterium]
MNRGQSTVELALIAPFVVGILALVLQGGVLISDQVALEQFAYAGAQWSTSMGGAATPAQIQNYVANIMCSGTGSATSPPSAVPPILPSTSATRFCAAEPSGVPQLTLATTPQLVSVKPASVSMRSPVDLPVPIMGVLAAPSTCQTWGLNASLSSSTVVAGGASGTGSTTVNISFTANSPGGNPTDVWPVVTLDGGTWPPGLSPQTPVPSPQQISPAGSGAPAGSASTSSVTINTTVATPPGTYHFSINGLDQCNPHGGPKGGNTALDLVVQGTVGASPASGGTQISGIQPPSVCAGTGTLINILGNGFAAGMTAYIGNSPLTGNTVVNPNDMQATTPAVAPGVYNITIFDSTGKPVANAAGAVTALAVCNAGSPSPLVTAPCAAGATSTEAVITITWNEPLAIPIFTSTNAPYFTLTARQVVLCISPPRPSPYP